MSHVLDYSKTSEFILLTREPMALECAEESWHWFIENRYGQEIEISQP